MNSIANFISIARIVLVLAIIFVRPLSIEFYVIYFVCGISDMLDGYIARKTGTESKFGQKLDSAADLIMVAVLIIVLYPIIDIPVKISYWIVGIILTRVASMITVFAKYKTFGILHTLGNKITGLMLFLFPLIIQSNVLIYILCIIGSISAIEEFLIHLISKELDANRRSIFYKTNHNV